MISYHSHFSIDFPSISVGVLLYAYLLPPPHNQSGKFYEPAAAFATIGKVQPDT